MTTHLKALLHTAVVSTALIFSSAAVAQDAVSKEDKEFIKNASELGLTEVEMGKLGQQKATDPQLKEFAGMLVKDHTKANQELMELAKGKGVELAAEPNNSQKRMLKGFASKSGEEFDKEFREHAIKDHEKAIRLFQDAARDTNDPAVKAFAAKHLPGMQKHLASLQGESDNRGTARTGRTDRKDSTDTLPPAREPAPAHPSVKTP